MFQTTLSECLNDKTIGVANHHSVQVSLEVLNEKPFASIVHLCPIFCLPFWRKPNTSRFTNPFSSDLFTTDRPAAVRSLRRNHRACGQNQPNLFSHGDRKQVVKPRDEWSAAGRFKSEKQPWVKLCKIM